MLSFYLQIWNDALGGNQHNFVDSNFGERDFGWNRRNRGGTSQEPIKNGSTPSSNAFLLLNPPKLSGSLSPAKRGLWFWFGIRFESKLIILRLWTWTYLLCSFTKWFRSQPLMSVSILIQTFNKHLILK
jgi:hypothetical protein